MATLGSQISNEIYTFGKNENHFITPNRRVLCITLIRERDDSAL